MSDDQVYAGVRVISVFNVGPEDQDEVVRMLIRTAREKICKQPGFLSTSINKSQDGRRVAIVSHWESADAFEAMFQKPDVVDYIRANIEVAQADWHIYDIVHRIEGPP